MPISQPSILATLQGPWSLQSSVLTQHSLELFWILSSFQRYLVKLALERIRSTVFPLSISPSFGYHNYVPSRTRDGKIPIHSVWRFGMLPQRDIFEHLLECTLLTFESKPVWSNLGFNIEFGIGDVDFRGRWPRFQNCYAMISLENATI